MSIAGTWHLSIATPIGTQLVVLELTEHDGTVRGSARGTAERVPLVDPVLTGDRLTWTQAITRPLRLNLAFDVTFDGENLSGTAKAGRLPRSTVTGTRAGS